MRIRRKEAREVERGSARRGVFREGREGKDALYFACFVPLLVLFYICTIG
jgi:hypothetical protein